MNILDKFCEMEGWPGWLVTFALITVVAVLIKLTHSELPMALLGIPGLYIIAVKQGARGLIKFVVGMAIVIGVLAFVIALSVPCDGWGEGFRIFYRAQC